MGARISQHGVALLTVLLVTALMSVLVLSMSWNRQMEMRRTANLAESDQARLLTLGLEDWAGMVLHRDRTQNDRDHLGEVWARGLPPTTVEQGVVSGQISDLQGRINLNNLAGEQTAAGSTEKQLARLLKNCGGTGQETAAIGDWLDKDGEIRPNGAEDRVYLIRQPPYRTGNRPMVSPTELLLVAGITPEIYACLAGAITTLPEPTPLNVNTASAQTLATLSDRLPPTLAEQLVKDRPTGGYKEMAEFLASPALAGTGLTGDGLTLASGYFLVEAQANFGHAEVRLYSVLHRTDTGLTTVLNRSATTY